MYVCGDSRVRACVASHSQRLGWSHNAVKVQQLITDNRIAVGFALTGSDVQMQSQSRSTHALLRTTQNFTFQVGVLDKPGP